MSLLSDTFSRNMLSISDRAGEIQCPNCSKVGVYSIAKHSGKYSAWNTVPTESIIYKCSKCNTHIKVMK